MSAVPRFAAIDVGSNALRLRIVEANTASPRAIRGGTDELRELHAERAPVRLGREVFLDGRLAPTAVSQACEALRRFRELLDLHKVERYRAVATSAVREAENSQLLVERARRESGIELDVIEGIEEARLVRLAIVGRLDLRDKRALLLDLGGGSLEISLVDRGQLRASKSLPIGTVRLLEAFHESSSGNEMAREYIDRQLLEVAGEIPRESLDVCVGTGGNFETLAALCPASDGAMSQLDVVAVRALLPKLAAMTTEERRNTFGLRPDRADVIVPAAEIIVGVASTFGVQRIHTPGIGLKEGVLDELIEKHFNVWDYGGEANASLESAIRLGRRFHFDEAHGALVAKLSADLFDQLLPLHRLGERDRLLLRVASTLHDVGDFIRYEGHHRHSYYILTNSDIVGLTPNERAIVANVARYHRKAPPDNSHPNFRDLDRDARGRVRILAGILRIADALDREHAGKVTALRAVIEKGRMRLHLAGAAERQLEEWTVGRKSQLFEEVFDLKVEIART